MKRVILAATLFFGIATVVSAQTSTGNASRTTGAASSTGTKSKAGNKPSDSLNNRKEYDFTNGQQSTPTGAEATSSGTGGGFAAIGRDTIPKAVTPPSANTNSKKPVANKKKRAKSNG